MHLCDGKACLGNSVTVTSVTAALGFQAWKLGGRWKSLIYKKLEKTKISIIIIIVNIYWELLLDQSLC